MDFNDSQEQAEFRQKVVAWLEQNVDKENTLSKGGMESEQALSEAREWQRKIFDAGWACQTWPKEYGGRGASSIEQVIWSQEVSKYPTREGFFAIGIGNCGPAIMLYGNETQKQELLPRMARADDIWCQMFSEPGAGSDVAGLKTRAEKNGDRWIVNGQKIWTSQAQYADYGVLLTRTDPRLAKHKGLTMFFLDMKQAGVEVRPIKQADGGQAFNEVFFTDVEIPDEQRLGEVNGGWGVALTVLMNERLAIAEVAPNGWPEYWDMIRELQLNGQPALQDDEVRRKTAEWYVMNAGLKNAQARMLSAVAKGGVPGAEASLGKLVGAPMCQDISRYALDLLAQSGACTEEELTLMNAQFQKAYLYAPGLRVAGGTDEVMRNIIAEQVLGLPPDVRVDKGVPFNEIQAGNQGVK
ncbi:MAG: acyl-CoA dehydrogenase family protein [Pseudomonadota bacterium]